MSHPVGPLAGCCFIAVVALAVTLSYTTECPTSPVATSGGEHHDGGYFPLLRIPDVLQYSRWKFPVPDDQIL